MAFMRYSNRKQASANETTLATWHVNAFIVWDLGNMAVAIRSRLYDRPAIGEAIGLLLSGLGLLVWIVWSLAHWKQDHELGLSGLLLLLLLPVIGILRSQLAPVIPILSIITFWLLAGVCLGRPAKDRSLGWLLGGTVFLSLLCLLTPSTSARLYLAGYRSPGCGGENPII